MYVEAEIDSFYKVPWQKKIEGGNGGPIFGAETEQSRATKRCGIGEGDPILRGFPGGVGGGYNRKIYRIMSCCFQHFYKVTLFVYYCYSFASSF